MKSLLAMQNERTEKELCWLRSELDKIYTCPFRLCSPDPAAKEVQGTVTSDFPPSKGERKRDGGKEQPPPHCFLPCIGEPYLSYV